MENAGFRVKSKNQGTQHSSPSRAKKMIPSSFGSLCELLEVCQDPSCPGGLAVPLALQRPSQPPPPSSLRASSKVHACALSSPKNAFLEDFCAYRVQEIFAFEAVFCGPWKCQRHQQSLPTCPSCCAAWRRRCVRSSVFLGFSQVGSRCVIAEARPLNGFIC